MLARAKALALTVVLGAVVLTACDEPQPIEPPDNGGGGGGGGRMIGGGGGSGGSSGSGGWMPVPQRSGPWATIVTGPPSRIGPLTVTRLPGMGTPVIVPVTVTTPPTGTVPGAGPTRICVPSVVWTPMVGA